MNILHQKLDADKYRATITSSTPILVTYQDLIEMADDLGLAPSGIAFCLNNDSTILV